MAKITISRLFELSKALATDAGDALKEPLTYLADFAEQTIRNLKNGLTFSDNFACKVATLSLTSGVASVVNTDGKTPTDILVTRVVSSANRLDSFGWWVTDSGETKVNATFTGSPTSALTVRLVIFF